MIKKISVVFRWLKLNFDWGGGLCQLCQHALCVEIFVYIDMLLKNMFHNMSFLHLFEMFQVLFCIKTICFVKIIMLVQISQGKMEL